MAKAETSGASPLSRLARNEAKIISYLQSHEGVMPTSGITRWSDTIELTPEQRTSLLRRFRDEPDIPVGTSKDELPLTDAVPDWANH